MSPAEVIPPPRRPLVFELVLVVLVSFAALVPGIWKYKLIDPWETHYGEVARTMLQQHDFAHTQWNGTSTGTAGDIEGFRSKPVLMFWMMAAGMQAVGVGDDGGYSGEMTASARTMIGVRLPFVLSAIAGLTLVWWMLARLLSRRAAWLALLVVGSTPIFCLIARNAIPDMPMVACTMGALALFIMAVEDGDRPLTTVGHVRRRRIDARHVVLAIAGSFVLLQAAYYAYYFFSATHLPIGGRVFRRGEGLVTFLITMAPSIWLSLLMVLGLGALGRTGWLIVRLPFVLIGGVIAAIVNEPMPRRAHGQPIWRHVVDNILTPWDRHALDRYLARALVYPAGRVAARMTWAGTYDVVDRGFRMAPITTMRQVYLLGCYFLLGVSLLAKGPPGLTVVALVGVLYVVFFHRWRALYEGGFEIKRGLILMAIVAVPWHVAMFLREGRRFVNEYIYTHILNRAASGVDNSPGTFEYYTSQIGHGMWLWAALLPAAFGAALLHARKDTREGRVRFLIALWAIVAVALFSLIQTKFHHYILPAIPPLAVLVALYLDDLASHRERLHPVYAGVAIGIVLLVCRDLMHEPERWIEMFVFRYDRPWPSAEPWQLDTSDAFLGLGLAGAAAIALAATRFRRLGVAAIGAVGLATCLWSLQVYMPVAAPHWGMGDAIATYYKQRTVYGQKLVYFSEAQLADDWAGAGDRWTFDTVIPDDLQIGQPMTISIQLNKDEKVMQEQVTLVGEVGMIGDHTVGVQLHPGERAKLDPIIARAAAPNARVAVRPPVRAVDADRLIAWQLYWRGENFWSGGEIWQWLPEMKTSFVNTNNVEFLKYVADRTRMPLGRRYFLVTEGGRIMGARASLPTQRAKDTYEVLDTTSNKFALAAFWL